MLLAITAYTSQFVSQEKDRLSFEAQFPVLIGFENWFGRGSKGTMIKKMNCRVEMEMFFER